MRKKTIVECIVRAAINTINHDGIEHAGYLAFLGLLALFPFLVLITALIGSVGEHTLAAEFATAIFQRLPAEIISALQPRIQEITFGPPQGLLTLAIVGAIWTASSAVEGLRTILNRAYHVSTPPNYLLRRSLSVLQLLIFAFILLIGTPVMMSVPLILQHLEEMIALPLLGKEGALIGQVTYYISLALMCATVAAIYYTLPNIKQHFISVAPGAVLVVALWIGTARLFAYYLQHFTQLTLIYGSLGGIIAALVFFYVCNIIFIFGAEFNYLFSRQHGMKIEEREETGLPPIDGPES